MYSSVLVFRVVEIKWILFISKEPRLNYWSLPPDKRPKRTHLPSIPSSSSVLSAFPAPTQSSTTLKFPPFF